MTTDGRDSKKVNDSIEIYRQWFEMFKNIDDKELQKYLYGILVKYYISNCKVRGIEGFVILDKIPEEYFGYILAGEILHIGKNSSFGFGRYEVR